MSRSASGPKTLKIFNHDLPKDVYSKLRNEDILAFDTETGGLDYRKDQLYLVQICTSKGHCFIIKNPDYKSNWLAMLLLSGTIKVFHNIDFDLRFIKASLGINVSYPLECTKTLVKMIKPECKSGLGSALKEILSIKIDKHTIKHKKWNRKDLTSEQKEYACNDVLYLIKLHNTLKKNILSPDILSKYKDAIAAIRTRAILETEGYIDIFEFEQDKYDDINQARIWWSKRSSYDAQYKI